VPEPGPRAPGPGREATDNAAWFERAQRVLPGGVDSPVRSFAAVGGTPYTVARAEGPHLWDVEGTRYIDMVQSYGAVLLGHAHPVVTDAVTRAATRGTTYGATCETEVLLAEAICARVTGCERVRLVSSGTEAAMSAVRVARGYTGRDRVVKFDGCYHGHADTLLAGGGSGVATLGLPGSAGVPRSAVADTVVAPYNVLPPLDDSVACVIVEPVAANMGVVAPAPGFLEGLRAACDAVGALLVFDEVITGFRLAPGGASATFGVTPDLWCFGKVIGGGFPVGAFGGRAEVLEVLAPTGPVYQAGTLSGSPVATAAGCAVLDAVRAADYEALCARAARFAAALEATLHGAGLPATVPVVGPVVGLFLSDEPVTDYATARAAVAAGRYPPFFAAMLERGVAMAPGPYEAMFPGMAHDDSLLDDVVARAADAAKEVVTQARSGW
jgi:glutamate-1-semialdehyde 2,1-aminomutase